MRTRSADNSKLTVSEKSRVYGHIPGVSVGTGFGSRKAVLLAGVHGLVRGGIHGDPRGGAFSICMSGGYEDDEDFGDRIIYVGSGGRDPKTKKQITGQSLGNYRNQSLYTSYLTGTPVRLVRGKNKFNPHAPAEGYRYDGLFVVDSATTKQGKSDHTMCFFELRKIVEENDGSPKVPEAPRVDSPAPSREDSETRVDDHPSH